MNADMNTENNYDYNQYADQSAQYADVTSTLSNVMTKVYMYMFVGLFITGAASLAVFLSDTLALFIFSNPFIFYGLMIFEVILVIIFSALLKKASFGVLLTCFCTYSLVNGLVLSTVFFAYTSVSIAVTFGTTSLMFAAMSLVGYFTKMNLNKIGSFCIMGLIGIIIASLLNVFLGSEPLLYLISFAAVLIFLGLTAYDTQVIKRTLMTARSEMDMKRLYLWGALRLYLDFINMFLYLLRFMGRKK